MQDEYPQTDFYPERSERAAGSSFNNTGFYTRQVGGQGPNVQVREAAVPLPYLCRGQQECLPGTSPHRIQHPALIRSSLQRVEPALILASETVLSSVPYPLFLSVASAVLMISLLISNPLYCPDI